MIKARRYHGIMPVGSVFVRIVKAGQGLAGFVEDVTDAGAEDSVYPTEQRPLDDVWRLVENKLEQVPNAPVYVDLEAGVDWNPRWGQLSEGSLSDD